MKPLLLHLQTVNFLQTCKYNQNAVANQSNPTNLLQFACRQAISATETQPLRKHRSQGRCA